MKNLQKKNSLIRKWIKDNGSDGFTSFDFKEKELIFYDGGFVSIKKKTKIHRKRRKSKFGVDLKIKKLACTFYFGALDETIDYLVKTKDFLNKMGYNTSETIGVSVGARSERFI